MANKYELMAARIEAVLGAQKVPARVWQATVSHRYIRFDLTIPLGLRIAKATTLEEELAFSLGVAAVKAYRQDGILHVEVPREDPTDYTLPYAFGQVQTYPPCTALLGERTDGTPLLLKVDSPDIAHLLISGTTGSGKTVLLKTILLTLAMTNHPGSVQLVLIDPKGEKLAPLAAYPHAWQGLAVISDPGDAVIVLEALVAEMRRRKGASSSLPRIVVAIDELAELITTAGPAIVDALQALTQAGREPGLHVIAATQRPSATLVGGMVKANFPARLVGSVVSTEDAKVAAGIGGTGAERLTGRGDFLLIAKGQQIRFQSTHVTDPQIRAICGAVWRNGRKSRAWSQFALEQVLGEQVLNDPPAIAERRAPRQVSDLVQQGGAPVHQLTPHAKTLAVNIPAGERCGAPVHTGANAALTAQRGTLPRRPDGPTAEDVELIKSNYSALGSLNKTCEWAYGSKGPLTMYWIKTALGLITLPGAGTADQSE